jgi:hypothetical protein
MYRKSMPMMHKRQIRKEAIYQVIVEDLFTIFGYGKDSPEWQKALELMQGKPDKLTMHEAR